MKNNRILTIIKVIALLLIASKSFAQADLFFEAGVTLPSYNAVEFDFNPVLMDFRINNMGTTDAGDGAELFLQYDTSSFMFDNFASSTAGWTCTTEFSPIPGLRCISPGSIVLNTPVDIQLAIGLGSTVPPGTYPFNGTVINNTGNDLNTLNDNINTQIVVMPPITDYEMILGAGITSPLELLTTTTGNIPFSFNLQNIGNTVGFGETANIVVDPGFSIGNVQVIGGGISTWNCSVVLGNDWNCTNTGPMGMLINNTAIISGDILTYPTIVGNTPNAIVASISESIDLNFANNSAAIDVNVSMPVVDTDLELLKFAKDMVGGSIIINTTLNTPFAYNIHVNNPSLVAGTNVVVTDNLPLGIEVLSDASTGSWNCTIGAFVDANTSQLVSCTHPSIAASQPSFNEVINLNVRGVSTGSKNNMASVVSTENDSNLGDNNDVAMININAPLPDIVVNKDAISGVFVDGSGTDVAEQGTQVTYKILAINNTMGSVNGSAVTISDTLPPGVSYAGHNVLGPNFNCNFTANTMDCNASSLPFTAAEDGVEITVDVTGVNGLFVDNSATVGAGNDVDPSNNTDNAIFTIVLPPVDLIVSKDAQTLGGISQGTYEINENFNYVLTVSNSGGTSAPIGEVMVTDVLPLDMDLNAIPTATGWDCSTSDLVTNTVNCINTTILPVSTPSQITIPVSSQIQGNYSNIGSVALTVSATVTEINTSNNGSNTSLVNIVPPAIPVVNLTLIKDAQTVGGATSVNNFLTGEVFEYKITAQNIGPNDAPAGEVQVVDNIPAGIDIQAGLAPPNWTCNVSGNTVTCLNDIPIASVTGFLDLIIPVSSQVANNYTNSADVALTTGTTVIESDTTDNNASFAVTINPASGNLTIAKSVTGGTVVVGANTNFAIGDTVIYTILAQNTSASNAVTDLIVNDVLDPTFLSFISFNIIQSGANFTCNFDGTSEVICANSAAGPFNPGDVFEVEIMATATTSGMNLSNIAHLSSVITGDNFDSAPVLIDIDPVVVATNLTVSKDAIVAGVVVNSVRKGTSFGYKVDVTNSGTADANNVIAIDSMPAGVTVNNINAVGWNCNNVGQQYTCNLTVPLIAGATKSIEFNVTDGSAAGVTQLINTIDVNADNALLQSAVNTIALTTVALNLNVTQTPDPIVENNPFEFRVEVINTGSEPLQGIVVENTLPAGFSYNTQNRASSCTISGQLMTCTVNADIAIGATETIVIPVNAIVTVDVNATYINMTNVSGSNFPAIVPVNTEINVAQSGDLNFRLDVADNVDPVEVGTQFSYWVFVENNGAVPINAMDININIPNSLTLGSFTGTDMSCNPSPAGLLCTNTSNLNLAVGESANLVSINVTSTSFIGNVGVIAQATANSQLQLTASESTTIVSNLVETSDLSIVKTASDSVVAANQPFSYTLTVFNNSEQNATNVSVIDNLPEGLVLESINASNWTCNNTTPVMCNIASLQANETSSIVINVLAPAIAGTITNTAQVTGDEQDDNAANNSSQASVNVTNIETDVSVVKKSSVESITSGGQFSWIIETTNNGPSDAQRVEITDQIPNGFEVTSINATNGAICNNSNDEIKCTIQLLAVQQTNTVTITGVARLESGVLDNVVSISSQTNDTDPANNTALASVVVEAVEINEADLAINISNTTRVDQGESFGFELNTSNIGPNAANKPVVNVVLSGLLDLVTVNPSDDWNCQVSGLTVSCQFNAEHMQIGGASNIQITTQTQQVVLDAQDITLNASISSSTDDPNGSNNSVNLQIEVTSTPTEGEILSAMQSALAGRGNQQVNRAIRNVSSYCERKFFSALEGLCRNLYQAALDGDGDTINNVMEQITPNEVIGQSTSVAEIASAQFKNIGSRLSQLRGGGGGGFSSAGLNARYGNGSIPLGMLAYLNQSEEEKEGLSKPIADFITPWGFFVNGTISMGERDATGRELGFDFDSYGLTAGVDYRLDAKKVIGLAIGYANFDSQVGDKAEIQSTGVTLTGYGSFYVNDNFYIDARISYGRPDFDQSREIDFTVGETHIQRTAKGTTTANQYSVAMSAGYHFNKNSWNITPNASFNYVKTNIDGFTETGAGGFNFLYSEQELESLVWSLGLKLTNAISLKNGVITPQFDIDYNYESKNDGNDIIARFLNAPADELFIIETDSPDRTYGSAGLGFVYITSNGKQAYINYRSVIGLEGFSRGTFNVGARFEF